MRRAVLLSLPLALALAPIAAAGDLELSASVDRAEVEVGGRFTVTVRLKNAGQEAKQLPQLALDRQLVSLRLQQDDGRSAFYEEIHPSPYAMRTDWPQAELKPGETWQLQVDLWALAVGAMTIEAHYGRWHEEYQRQLAEAESKAQASPDNPALKAQVTSVKKMVGVGEVPHVVAQSLTVKVGKAGDGSEQVSVRMLTNMGLVRLRLFPRDAPATSQHFARLIRAGGEADGERRVPFYRGLTFHRVIQGFMIQGGCPQGTGLGGPGYAIPAELASKDPAVPERLRHVPGRLSMARSGHYDSAGSQFFICTGVSEQLDGEYTVFGEVTQGMDVVDAIAEVPTGAKDKPLEDVTIELIELLPHADG